MTVRDARQDEFADLAAVTLAAYRDLLGPAMDAGYAAELADVDGRAGLVDLLVSVDEAGTVEGGVVYIPGPGPMAWFHGEDEAGLRMLAVDPGAQGRGVGTALVVACLARAAGAGKRRLLLHTTASMTAARRLYERAGFRRDVEHDHLLAGGVALLAYVADVGQ